MKYTNIPKIISYLLVFVLIGLNHPSFSNASTVDDLKNKIEERNSNIIELEEEIKEYQEQLEIVGEEKKTLNNEVYRLNLDRKKITTDISITNNKIYATSLSIEKLGIEVEDKGQRIKKNMVGLSESVKLMNEYDSNSLVEVLLSNDDLSEFWDDIEGLQRFQIGVRKKTSELKNLKISLEENKKETEEKERELIGYRSELSDQKSIVEYNKKEKDQLLSLTESKESNYKKILTEKQKLRDEFEKELKDLESQLKVVIDPGSIPDANYGILNWPLDKIKIPDDITQYFGNTAFSTQNPQVYKGKGHTGIDFRASSGTKVKAALGGVVQGIGNTDTIPPKCYSYGKWVLIKHNNGLSTLYAHLSLIKVSPGQAVNSGDIIGYSGNTGYSTGPHLHFSVYATAGVQITKFENSINCKNKYIPLAPYNAYLNPLSYLPKYK